MKRSLPFGGLVAPTVGNEWQSAFSPFKLRGMKIRQSGFTLIELLIVVAIAAILLSLAAPNFREMLVKRSVQAAGETLASDMRYARSEALKRSTATVMCRSTDGARCSNVQGGWSDGWIVYVDSNNTAINTIIPAQDVVKVQQPLANIASIQNVNLASTKQSFKFEPTGRTKGANDSLVITPTGSVPNGSTRLLCISVNGRPALRVQGAAACV
jgi:type IV fimbrial biogenesis protein FimT